MTLNLVNFELDALILDLDVTSAHITEPLPKNPTVFKRPTVPPPKISQGICPSCQSASRVETSLFSRLMINQSIRTLCPKGHVDVQIVKPLVRR